MRINQESKAGINVMMRSNLARKPLPETSDMFVTETLGPEAVAAEALAQKARHLLEEARKYRDKIRTEKDLDKRTAYKDVALDLLKQSKELAEQARIVLTK